MDDRFYLAEAFLESLRAERVSHSVLADGANGQIEVAVSREVLQAVPAILARYARAFDLQLVHLGREGRSAWRAVLAWSDEIGRPRFLAAELFSDWRRAGRLLLRAEELLTATPDVRFIHRLLGSVFRERLDEEEGRLLSGLWEREPRGAMEQIARFWSRPSDMRLVAQAARHGSWTEAARKLPALRSAMRGGSGSALERAAGLLGRLAEHAVKSTGAVIAFVGADGERRESLRQAVARDLAPAFPAGLATVAHGFGEEHRRVDVRVVLGGSASSEDDEVLLEPSLPPSAAAAKAERAILRWLECRVERRFPAALVGENPAAARLLQLACRSRVPLVSDLVRIAFNSDLDCALRSPVLMPHPYGIVIERGTQIGSRVTIMQQASLERTAQGAPVVEDNVIIGAGARIAGPVRIGRGATVGANAVVTRDVPSHCTVVERDRILGRAPREEGLSSPDDEARIRTVVNS